MTPEERKAALAEAAGEHTPVYDYRAGRFTMECEGCDFLLFGINREEAKSRFGGHIADALAPLVEEWIAESKVAALVAQEGGYAEGYEAGAAAVVARVEALSKVLPDADHCHGLVVRDGIEDACGKPPTSIIDDPDGGPWPACTYHAHRYGHGRVLSLVQIAAALTPPCPTCDGVGERYADHPTGDPALQRRDTCRDCDGTGEGR